MLTKKRIYLPIVRSFGRITIKPHLKGYLNITLLLFCGLYIFREFYYIQMEKYARQAIAEGCKHGEELVVTTDSELYRVLNLHYNRNNQIDVSVYH